MLYREVIDAFHYWDGDGAMVGIVGMVVGIAGKGGNAILGAEGMDGNGGKFAIAGRGLAAESGGNAVDCGRACAAGIAGEGW
uniref:Uncharacterized protein n=1 Tax=Chenopodium quinoa TaxID=63459 RepID=A0A803NF31_CHEQI